MQTNRADARGTATSGRSLKAFSGAADRASSAVFRVPAGRENSAVGDDFAGSRAAHTTSHTTARLPIYAPRSVGEPPVAFALVDAEDFARLDAVGCTSP
jgi:hypothetical protein